MGSAQVFPISLHTDVRSERKVGCFFFSIQLNICSTPVLAHMLSSLTPSLQSSAMRIAAHTSNSSLWLVIPPCAFKTKGVFAFLTFEQRLSQPQPQLTSGMSLWIALPSSSAAFRQCVLLRVPYLLWAKSSLVPSQCHHFPRSLILRKCWHSSRLRSTFRGLSDT